MSNEFEVMTFGQLGEPQSPAMLTSGAVAVVGTGRTATLRMELLSFLRP